MSVLCSAPEYSLPTDTPRTDLPDRFTFKLWGDNEPEWRRNKYSAEVMVGLFALCDEFGDFVNFGYDWAGSSTAEPADLDPERRVRACCMSLGCSCGSARSTKIVKGAVDWSDPKSVAGSLWFPKYFTKVMGAIHTGYGLRYGLLTQDSKHLVLSSNSGTYAFDAAALASSFSSTKGQSQ